MEGNQSSLPHSAHNPVLLLRASFITVHTLVGVVHHTLAAHGVHSRILDIIQREQQLTLLAVHVGLRGRHIDDREDALGLVEDAVHFLQRTVGRLGIEEVGDGKDGRVTGEVSRREKKKKN